jgi:predicted nucleotidyltransferase component of viral defense system
MLSIIRVVDKYVNYSYNEFMLTEQQAVEIFHLLFLRALKNYVNSSFYALKGGCNLRFFFESIRYSEDIDLDISVISVQTLSKNVDKLLYNPSFLHTLLAYGLEVTDVSPTKQTQTVQRWKVGIKVANKVRAIPTKIEFSRRNHDLQRVSEPISSLITQQYKMQPLILPHYALEAALKQKIDALIFRTETQARDIFDLYYLFKREPSGSFQYTFDLQKAIDCVFSISFDDFTSQVVHYLLPEFIEYYHQENTWAEVQLFVIDHLKSCHHEAR